MRVLIAPDKFKGSLTALEAAEAIRTGFRQGGATDFIFDLAPMADGGEGTADAFLAARSGQRIEASSLDARGRPIIAAYAFFPEDALAVIDLSAASGLWRLQPAERDPLATSTVGTGLLMADAIARGAHTLQIGLGGSATNDAGLGMAHALGWRFLDDAGEEVPPEPRHFLRIQKIQTPAESIPVKVTALCDVENPLLGARGASRVFGPQKGAGSAQVTELEMALRHVAELCTQTLERDYREVPGAGAAGGSAFGLMTFCAAELEPGFAAVAKLLRLEERIAAADLVVTGEGRIDAQSLSGKGPGELARLARRAGKPCLAFGGSVETGLEEIDACMPLPSGPISLERSMAEAPVLLREAAARAARLLLLLPRR